MLKYRLRGQELHTAHIDQASLHFTEERVRVMELQARRLKYRNSLSAMSDTAASEVSDII